VTLTQELVPVKQFGQVDVSLGRLYRSHGVPQHQVIVLPYLLQIPVIRVGDDVVDWMNTKQGVTASVGHGECCSVTKQGVLLRV
jgi:hypothetical protein